MDYKITEKQVTCINILIKALEESIKRGTFNKEEIEKLMTTIDCLCKK